MRYVLGWLLALFATQGWTHEVRLAVGSAQAAVVSLNYADGQPFAFEAYELYASGREMPEQVGRTSAQGQIVFVPGQQTAWRLKAWSADGHGVDQVLTVALAADGGAQAPEAAALPRSLLLGAGLGIVFGLFGLVQLFLRKPKT